MNSSHCNKQNIAIICDNIPRTSECLNLGPSPSFLIIPFSSYNISLRHQYLPVPTTVRTYLLHRLIYLIAWFLTSHTYIIWSPYRKTWHKPWLKQSMIKFNETYLREMKGSLIKISINQPNFWIANYIYALSRFLVNYHYPVISTIWDNY